MSRMTLREKVRQMDMYVGSSFVKLRDGTSVVTDDAEILWDKVAEAIGSEGIGCIHDLYATAKINNEIQRYAIEKTRLGIPILFSEEGLHGLCRPGCTIFPQSIALASTWRPEIVEEVGRAIARRPGASIYTRYSGQCLTLQGTRAGGVWRRPSEKTLT